MPGLESNDLKRCVEKLAPDSPVALLLGTVISLSIEATL